MANADRCRDVMQCIAILIDALRISTRAIDDDDRDDQYDHAGYRHTEQSVAVVRGVQQSFAFAFEARRAHPRHASCSDKRNRRLLSGANRLARPTFLIVVQVLFLLILEHFDGIDIVDAEEEDEEHRGVLGVDIVEASVPECVLVVVVVDGQNQLIDNQEEQQPGGEQNAHLGDVGKELATEIGHVNEIVLTDGSVLVDVAEEVVHEMIDDEHRVDEHDFEEKSFERAGRVHAVIQQATLTATEQTDTNENDKEKDIRRQAKQSGAHGEEQVLVVVSRA